MDFGLILDLETTGLNPEVDKIIEIGILEFAVETNKTPAITNMYGALEDPGVPVTEEVEKITGLNNSILSGQKIDWDIVRGYFDRASIAIAHNAGFDRSFLLKRPEDIGANIHWGCSLRHIDWKGLGFKTANLNYLAADHGFVNPFAHRALFDCATTFRIVAPRLHQLIERSYMREYKVSAVSARFEVKDLLKERGYRWEAERRVWQKIIVENELASEREFLADEIYNGHPLHEEEDVSLNA